MTYATNFEERSIARLINLLDSADLVFNSDINKISQPMEQLIRKILVKDHFKRIGWEEIFAFNVTPKEENFNRRYSDLSSHETRSEVRTPLSEKQVQEVSISSTGKSKGTPTAGMFKKKPAVQN